MTKRRHLLQTFILLLLLLSPLGAPTVGVLLLSICPTDMASPPADTPFSMPGADCGISRPVERLYQAAVWLPLTPSAVFGPWLGQLLLIIWWSLALSCAVLFAWTLFGTIWRFVWNDWD
jgi:hypothetical protein